MTKYQLIWILLSYMVILGQSSKKLIYTRLQCAVKSNLVSKVDCYIDNNSSINVDLTTNNIVVNRLLGLTQIHLFIHGQNNVMRLNGIRLDICKIIDNSDRRKSIVTMLYMGIMKSDNNFPKKCPLKQNTTYMMHNMKFDANYLPTYLPEYNFTFTGVFQVNNVKTFEMWINGSFCNNDNNYNVGK